MVSRIRSCFSGGVAVPARGEAFSFIFEKDSGRSGSRGARRELRARTGGRRVARERGRCEGLLRARAAMCLCGALSSKPPRARAHGLKRSRTRVRERVVLSVGGGAEGSSLRGRGEHRGRRGGGGLDAKCHALAPTARGISLACGRLVVGTGPRSDGGPHTPERARGENTGMQQGGGGLDANCHALATGAVHPSSRARASRRPVGNGNPAECGGAQTRSACAFVTKGVDGVPALALARHTTRTGTHTRTRARVGGSLARMWPLSAVRGGRGRV